MLIKQATNSRVLVPLVSYIQVPLKKGLKYTFSISLQPLIIQINCLIGKIPALAYSIVGTGIQECQNRIQVDCT